MNHDPRQRRIEMHQEVVHRLPNSGANGYGVMFGGRSGTGADTSRAAWCDVVTNRRRVWAERDSVRFVVNGKALAALPRASVEPDGLFGLRLEEGINMHVTNVDHSVRLLKP